MCLLCSLKLNFLLDKKNICFLRTENEKENADANDEGNTEEDLENPGLVEEEEKDVGLVKYEVYRSYWRSAGVCLTISIFLSLFLMQGK